MGGVCTSAEGQTQDQGPFLLAMARVPESWVDFRQRGLQETHCRTMGLGAGEANDEWRVPRNHRLLQRLKSEGTQKPPISAGSRKEQRWLSEGWTVTPHSGQRWLSMETGGPWWSWPHQGSTLEREEPDPEGVPHPPPEPEVEEAVPAERAPHRRTALNKIHRGGAEWGAPQLLTPPLPSVPTTQPSSEQGCHQTHWLPSSEMNSAPSNYSSSSFPSSV